MLDVLGDDYIAQHIDQCMLQEARERAYRAYITDALYCCTRPDLAMQARWRDIDTGTQPIKPKKTAWQAQQELLAEINEGRQSAE